jgi:putative membrane protein
MNWTLVTGLGFVVLVVLLIGGGLLGGWGMMGRWMMGPSMMGGLGFPFVGGVLMLAFWVLVIGGIVWFVQSLTRGTERPRIDPSSSETPLEVLKHRYVAGEITQEQFEEMKRVLDL